MAKENELSRAGYSMSIIPTQEREARLSNAREPRGGEENWVPTGAAEQPYFQSSSSSFQLPNYTCCDN